MPSIQKFVVTPNLPDPLKPLLDIARNVWWTWNVEAITLLRRVDPDLWDEHDGNPDRRAGQPVGRSGRPNWSRTRPSWPISTGSARIWIAI